MSEERIAASAVRIGDEIFSLPPPARHHHVMQLIWDKLGKTYIEQEMQGFVTDTGRFVDREEGHRIAKAAGQLIPRAGGFREGEINDVDGSDLFSEDLW